MDSGLFVVRMPALATGPGAAAALQRAAISALSELTLLSIGEIRNHMASKGRVDRGLLANSISALRVEVGPARASQRVVSQGPPSAYVAPVESGRRSGARRPPVAPIRRWLERKRIPIRQLEGESRARALDRVAFLLAHAIGRRGIPGIGMFAHTRQQLERGRAAEIVRRHTLRELGRAS